MDLLAATHNVVDHLGIRRGWPDWRATRDFQAAFNVSELPYPVLKVDGIYGPKTSSAVGTTIAWFESRGEWHDGPSSPASSPAGSVVAGAATPGEATRESMVRENVWEWLEDLSDHLRTDLPLATVALVADARKLLTDLYTTPTEAVARMVVRKLLALPFGEFTEGHAEMMELGYRIAQFFPRAGLERYLPAIPPKPWPGETVTAGFDLGDFVRDVTHPDPKKIAEDVGHVVKLATVVFPPTLIAREAVHVKEHGWSALDHDARGATQDVARAVRNVDKVVRDVRPYADLGLSILQGATSVIPGLGTPVAAALGAAQAILDGGGALAIAIHTAYAMIPIPPGLREITDPIVDAVIALADGKDITDAAIYAIRDKLPPGLPRQVFDTLAHVVAKKLHITKTPEAVKAHYVARYNEGAAAGDKASAKHIPPKVAKHLRRIPPPPPPRPGAKSPAPADAAPVAPHRPRPPPPPPAKTVPLEPAHEGAAAP